jgi:hypothetical protein
MMIFRTELNPSQEIERGLKASGRVNVNLVLVK